MTVVLSPPQFAYFVQFLDDRGKFIGRRVRQALPEHGIALLVGQMREDSLSRGADMFRAAEAYVQSSYPDRLIAFYQRLDYHLIAVQGSDIGRLSGAPGKFRDNGHKLPT